MQSFRSLTTLVLVLGAVACASNGGAGASGGAASASGGSENTAGAGATSGGASSGGAVASGGAAAGAAPLANPPPLTDTVTLHIAGDSTAAVFPADDPRVGWAAVLQQFFGDGVVVNDKALSGRSTKSYIDEGAWVGLESQIKQGDYLFIEFGHNDEKIEDPTRFTDATTTYRDNLRIFIDGARAKGGYPVLMTPIARRKFSGTKVPSSHALYPQAVKIVGAEKGVPVIDMEAKTTVWLEALGVDASLPMFAPADNTHLSAMGAPEVARLAVDGIREAGFPIGERLLPAP
ncbi:MAG: rhamnogalacturonan acetylesterase [Polyangiaceae bacterium]